MKGLSLLAKAEALRLV